MTCERTHRNREAMMEVEPGAGAGGRVGGCPQKPRGLFLRLPSRYGRSPETAASEERGASTKDRREDQHAGVTVLM